MSDEYDRAVSMGWGPATNAAPADDLKERLRANHLDECYDAIDRIEELEAKLGKAVNMLEAALKYNTAMHGGAAAYNQRIKAAIAELTGGKDE